MLGLRKLSVLPLMLLVSQPVIADLLVFASGVGPGADIVLLDPDNGTQVRITETPSIMKWAPTWSPDATRLAWFEDWGSVEGSITVASLEGQIITRLIGVPAPYPPSPEVYSSSKLSWSPDGSRLAYPTSTGDLAIVEIVSETQTVFDLGKYDTIWGAVSWLIGGTGLVAFDDGELVIIHTDGSIGEKRRVTVDGGVPGFDPTVSRDGRMLAFLSEPYGFACMDGPCIQSTNDSHPQLYVMGIQDTLATRLTESGTMKCRPTWSPDGSWLAYAEQQNGGWDLFALSVEGGMVRQLTRGPALDFDPNWGQGQPTAVPSLSWAKVKELIR